MEPSRLTSWPGLGARREAQARRREGRCAARQGPSASPLAFRSGPLGNPISVLGSCGTESLLSCLSLASAKKSAAQFPGGLVARIRRFHRRGPGSIPGQGNFGTSRSFPPKWGLPSCCKVQGHAELRHSVVRTHRKLFLLRKPLSPLLLHCVHPTKADMQFTKKREAECVFGTTGMPPCASP